jgi:hypothetical protein
MSAELGRKVQEVVDRMARNDPTMTRADLYSECAAADGAAAVASLHRCRCRRGVCVVLIVCAPLNRRVHQNAN